MMPFYDFKCDNCEKTIELFHSMKEEPDQSKLKCTKCLKGKLIKQISPVSIAFKGLGWNRDGYSKDINQHANKIPKI